MFVTVAELEEYLQRTFTAAEVASAELSLELATEVIRGYTGQRISPVTTGDVYEVFRPSARVFLPHPPVIPITVTQVQVDGTAVDAADWRHLNRTHAVERTDGKPWVGTVTVTYNHGFAETPGDVKAVILQAAQRAFTNPQGIQSERIGQYSITYTEGFGGSLVGAGAQLTNVESKILDRYRLLGVA